MTLYDSMVESYAPQTAAERFAVQQEVMQLIALAGLARGGLLREGGILRRNMPASVLWDGAVLRGHGFFSSRAKPLV